MTSSMAIPVNSIHLIAAATTLVIVSFLVGALMLSARVRELKRKRLHPQAVSTSAKAASPGAK